MNEMKSQKLFMTKTDRVIKSVHRDGILGVELPGDPDSYFYSDNCVKAEKHKSKYD